MKPVTKNQDDLLLWIPVFIGFGVAFFFSFEKNFLDNFPIFIALFCCALFFYFLNRDSRRSLVFLACATFLFGCFYANFYPKIFLNHTEITGKIYVDVVGKVESIKNFTNPINHLEGATLVISEPKMYKSQFVKKSETKKAPKKIKKKKKKSEKKSDDNPKPKKIKKTKEQKALDKEQRALRAALKLAEKEKKAQEKINKKITKDFLNVENYQEIDRKFLDYQKNYQQVEWRQIKDREVFPNPPQKISVNLVKFSHEISINDKIALRAMLQPVEKKEFEDDFDFALDAKAKKIGAYGFAMSEVKILKKADISSVDAWFLKVREDVRAKILAVLNGDSAAIALAFLIGDQSQISKDLMQKIRNSGLAHLLSISGFHLSLAGAIFFFSTRFLLSRSEYLALNFDLKKIAAIAAIFATYFYLKLAASPVPAQRAFLMILLVFLALFFDEKINAKRAIMTSILALILYNPYVVFNVSFQLSFAAILVLGVFYEEINRQVLPKFLWYFFEMILLSIFIQIATLPFLMHSFQNVSLLGFISNIAAIPLTSFFIMPLGFLALFAMPLALEKFLLLLMNEGIFYLEKIIVFVADLDHSHFTSPRLTGFGLALGIFGLLLICLLKTRWRWLGIFVFVASLFLTSSPKKPVIIFEQHQKFFAIYDENGLVFSEKLRPSRQRDAWMKRFGESEFKMLNPSTSLGDRKIICEKEKCLIEKNQKILVLLKRNKISEICKNDFDVIVNLTAKYQLPECISDNKIKIDNSDFLRGKTQFLFFKN